MRQATDQGACCVARELGISVESNHELDRTENGLIANDVREGRMRIAAEPGVELLELATLALVAHPHALNRIPHPWAVQ